MSIRVFEAFSGYGSQAMALERLKDEYPEFDYEIVGISEIDPYAIRAYMAVHGETTNYGDISQIEPSNLPDIDLFTYSFPCTDISTAGLQKGLSEGGGTRSGLLWECRKIILAKRPKYLIMENVKALLSDKFIGEFRKWNNELAELGYNIYTAVLNARNYGIPQDRERVISVGILGDTSFNFPAPIFLKRTVETMLEHDVANELYFSPEKQRDIKSKCPSIKDKIVGYTRDGKGIVTQYHAKDVANTVHTKIGSGGNTDQFVCEWKVRRLTSREALRLMDVADADIDKMVDAGIPTSQLYKMAGNSIVVSVLYHVFKQLLWTKKNGQRT